MREISSALHFTTRSFHFNRKMNLSNLLVTNLLANLTIFLDRLIIDGNYKTVLLTYDDAYINNIDFVGQMVDKAGGKYTMLIKKSMDEVNFNSHIITPLRSAVLLLIAILKFDDFDDCPTHFNGINSAGFIRYNLVLLIPMPSDDQQEKSLWRCIRFGPSKHINTSVVFYQTEVSMNMVNSSRKSIEIYALNYKVDKIDGDGNVRLNLDVENSFYKGQLNESNLHGQIFGSIIKKPNLIIDIETFAGNFPRKAFSHGNFGSADLYLSNFIAQNLHFKDVMVNQEFHFKQITFKNGIFLVEVTHHHTSSNRGIYRELYNELLGGKQNIYRFEPTRENNYRESCQITVYLLIQTSHNNTK